MLLTFIFSTEEVADSVLESVGKSRKDADIKFAGILSYPVDTGNEIVFTYTTEKISSYFVIISTDNLNLPAELMLHEYDYSYPVAEGMTFAG